MPLLRCLSMIFSTLDEFELLATGMTFGWVVLPDDDVNLVLKYQLLDKVHTNISASHVILISHACQH